MSITKKSSVPATKKTPTPAFPEGQTPPAAKKSRFDAMRRTSQHTAAESHLIETEEAREAISTQIRSDLKVALKHASVVEGRKLYQVLEDALEDYLKQKHPNYLK